MFSFYYYITQKPYTYMYIQFRRKDENKKKICIMLSGNTQYALRQLASQEKSIIHTKKE